MNRPPSPWRWRLCCALLLGLSILVFLPAALMAWLLPLATASGVQLADTRGSFWRGSAVVIIGNSMMQPPPSETENARGTANVAAQMARTLAGRIHWELGMATWRSLQLRWRLDCCTTQWAEIQLGWLGQGLASRVTIPDLRLPLALLEGLGTPWDTLQLRGEVWGQVPQMVWSAQSGTWQGQAQARIKNMYTALSTVRPLGTYSLQWNPGAEVPTIDLTSTPDSALQIAGQVRAAQGRLQVDLKASAASGYENQLEGLLQILGRRDGNTTTIHF